MLADHHRFCRYLLLLILLLFFFIFAFFLVALQKIFEAIRFQMSQIGFDRGLGLSTGNEAEDGVDVAVLCCVLVLYELAAMVPRNLLRGLSLILRRSVYELVDIFVQLVYCITNAAH